MKNIKGKWCNSGIEKCSVKSKKMKMSLENYPKRHEKIPVLQAEKENQNNIKLQNS
jgi:hypothetical protein